MNQNKQSQLYSAEALRLNSHKTMRKLFLAVFAFFMTATLTFLITQNMKNTNAASFQAGNIMSDAVMGNYNSMSEADIQNFLKSKNSCNKYSSSAGDYSETYGSKTYTWHVRNHRYVCMADDTFNGESAAHIIYTVAHEYRINPQVLIVLLQKEQGLITDQFPNSWQYNKAAGFGCPDTAPCDAQYYGLRTQLSKAANLFRTVLDGGWSNYPVGNNYVQFHPNQACGGSVINIENRATSALYRYTPYQPNGALLCGGSDGCSSYGNYNFYNYFTSWFGDTHAYVNMDPDPNINSIFLPENETFIFKTTRGTALSFDGTENRAQAMIATVNSSDQLQQFKAIRDGRYYRFKNVASGRFLDVNGAKSDLRTKVELWDGNDSCAQKWMIQLLDDGTYHLRSACSKYYALDIKGGGDYISEPGTIVHMWKSHQEEGQRWRITSISTPIISNNSIYNLVSTGNKSLNLKDGNSSNGTDVVTGPYHTGVIDQYVFEREETGYYHLRNASTGRYLDVSGASSENGAIIQNWDKNSSCAQQWIIENNSNSTYRLRSACSGKSLDIRGGGDKVKTDDVKIEIFDNNNSNAQQWQLKDPLGNASVDDAIYVIKSGLNTNLALDASASSAPYNGTNIMIFNYHGDNNQQFAFKYNSSSGTFSVTNLFTNAMLDTSGALPDPGRNVQSWSSNTSCAQKWVLSKYADNSYKIINVCGMKSLDAQGAKAISGANVITWTNHDNSNQHWYLERRS